MPFYPKFTEDCKLVSLVLPMWCFPPPTRFNTHTARFLQVNRSSVFLNSYKSSYIDALLKVSLLRGGGGASRKRAPLDGEFRHQRVESQGDPQVPSRVTQVRTLLLEINDKQVKP